MERPQARIEQPIDEYDHELTRVQADIVALADELLKSRAGKNRMRHAIVALSGDSQDLVAELQSSPVGHLLASPNKQLASKSDGTYRPVVDVRKRNATLMDVSLQVFGDDYPKLRYTNPESERPPYDFKKYPGQKDKTRELRVKMRYQSDNPQEDFSESIVLYTSTVLSDYVTIGRHVYINAYQDQGYEGNVDKEDRNISDEALEWLLEFIAKHIDDES